MSRPGVRVRHYSMPHIINKVFCSVVDLDDLATGLGVGVLTFDRSMLLRRNYTCKAKDKISMAIHKQNGVR